MAGIFEPLYGKQSAWSRTTQNTYFTEPKYEPKLEAKLKEEQKIKSDVSKDTNSVAASAASLPTASTVKPEMSGFGFWMESNKMKLLLLVAIALVVAFIILYSQQQKQRKILAGMRKKMKMLRG